MLTRALLYAAHSSKERTAAPSLMRPLAASRVLVDCSTVNSAPLTSENSAALSGL
jgi:hypothetical protein